MSTRKVNLLDKVPEINPEIGGLVKRRNGVSRRKQLSLLMIDSDGYPCLYVL